MARFRASAFSVLAITLLSGSPVPAQSTKPAAPAVPRTPDGKPDLQGFWDFRTLTPLERPASQAGKAFLTEEEAQALQQQNSERRTRAAAPGDPRSAPRTPGGGGVA